MRKNLIKVTSVFLFIILVLILGNIITIGNKIGALTHVYVEYAFYLLILISFFIFVLRPILKVHNAPEVPQLTADNKQEHELYDFAVKLADNCNYIPNQKKRNKHKIDLLKSIRSEHKNEELKSIIEKEINRRLEGDESLGVPGINKRIKEWAKIVFLTTAISQNGKVDSLAVLVLNYKMIADIVLASGFRPTKPQMFKLYVNILTTALVTYFSSQVLDNMDDIVGSQAGNLDGDLWDQTLSSLKSIPMSGAILGSFLDGCINALMTLRIGYVTRSYLTKSVNELNGIKNKRIIKKEAMKEALDSLPSVVKTGVSFWGKSVKGKLFDKIFNPKKDTKRNTDRGIDEQANNVANNHVTN